MDESAIERARLRVEAAAAVGQRDPALVDAVLQRARAELEALAAAASELESTLPQRVEHAVQDGLRDQVLPVGRNLAEIRGLMNQVIRRLERIEGDTLTERNARVDDLALLVDLVSSGWKGVDQRIARLEHVLGRLEKGLEERGGAIVYRIEDRRPDATANS